MARHPRWTAAARSLWVTRDDHAAGPLVIEAALDGSPAVASRNLAAGPGPSIVDLPAPGGLRLALHWPGHADHVSLPYRAR